MMDAHYKALQVTLQTVLRNQQVLLDNQQALEANINQLRKELTMQYDVLQAAIRLSISKTEVADTRVLVMRRELQQALNIPESLPPEAGK